MEHDKLSKVFNDILGWLKDHPNASMDNIKQQQKKFEDETSTVLKRVEEMNALDDYGDEMERRLNEDQQLLNLSGRRDRRARVSSSR